MSESSTTIEGFPVTPGEILAEEFMAGYGLTQRALARMMDVSVQRISEIVRNRRSISADTALRLGKVFGQSPQFWLNLQANYDLKVANRDVDLTRVSVVA